MYLLSQGSLFCIVSCSSSLVARAPNCRTWSAPPSFLLFVYSRRIFTTVDRGVLLLLLLNFLGAIIPEGKQQSVNRLSFPSEERRRENLWVNWVLFLGSLWTKKEESSWDLTTTRLFLFSFYSVSTFWRREREAYLFFLPHSPCCIYIYTCRDWSRDH